MLNMAMGFGIPFVRKHMISVLASDTVRPNAALDDGHPQIIFLAARAIAKRFQDRQRKVCPKTTSPELALRRLLPPAPPFFLRCIKTFLIYLSALRRVWATYMTAAKNILNMRGTRKPCRRAARVLACHHRGIDECPRSYYMERQNGRALPRGGFG